MMKIDKINNSNKLLEHVQISNKKLSAKIYPNLGGSIQELIVNESISLMVSVTMTLVFMIMRTPINHPFFFHFQTG